jgi:Family of unknown function (DUF6064)
VNAASGAWPRLPFTRELFIAVFADYIAAVWPAQVAAYLVGLVMVAAVLRPSPAGQRLVFGLLLLTTTPVPRAVLAISLARSLLSGSAAFLLGAAQDWPLLFSGIAVVLLTRRDRQRPVPARP